MGFTPLKMIKLVTVTTALQLFKKENAAKITTGAAFGEDVNVSTDFYFYEKRCK